MEISRAAYDHYWEKGWAVVEGVFSPQETEALAQIALTVAEGELVTDQSAFAADHAADGQIAPRKIAAPFTKHPAFCAFSLDPRLTGLVAGLLGQPALLATDQIFMKPPRFGSAKPYHQDNFYFRLTPPDQALTAWIALDDVDEQNGCLRYIAGSHRGPILPHTPVPGEPYNLVPDPALIDLHLEVLAPVGKGGVIFHHSQVLHTSHRNESNRWRRGYATHWVTAQVTSANTTLDYAYYLREDYPKTSG
ncbi:MAG: phytanoyl-CoA dioxygenase family protein [Candidatus Latescibacteria bacterium]|nr:phytanoyl-CoA dioxygenase family protein [Candidatus Latescibacterota bacterium]